MSNYISLTALGRARAARSLEAAIEAYTNPVAEMNSIELEHIEFIYNSLREVADRVAISGLDYYVIPAVILDEGVAKLKKRISTPSGRKEK